MHTRCSDSYTQAAWSGGTTLWDHFRLALTSTSCDGGIVALFFSLSLKQMRSQVMKFGTIDLR